MRTERTVTLHLWKWTITPGDRLWIVEYGRHLAQRRVHKSDSKQKHLIKSLSSLRDWEGYIRRESVKPTCVYMCVCVMWWGREHWLSRPLLRFYKEVFLLSFGWSRSFASSWMGWELGVKVGSGWEEDFGLEKETGLGLRQEERSDQISQQKNINSWFSRVSVYFTKDLKNRPITL